MTGWVLAITQPSLGVGAYAQELLTAIAALLSAVLPFAAAVTGFVIGVTMLKRWLGHMSATSLGSGGGSRGGANYCSYDCYDDGGCSRCSTWETEHDKDYGDISHWRKMDAGGKEGIGGYGAAGSSYIACSSCGGEWRPRDISGGLCVDCR